MVQKRFLEKGFHELFDVSITIKGVEAVTEAMAGLALLLIHADFIGKAVAFLTQYELAEDPGDAIANTLLSWAQHFTANTKWFIASFLLSHGVVKVGLVVALLRKKPWAYPAAIVVFILFILQQLYQFTRTHSLLLGTLAPFNMLVVVLIAHEYRHMRERQSTNI